MATMIDKMKWKLQNYKYKALLIWGLKNGHIVPYSDELIEKLRTIYYGGIPASIILLSNGMSNGHCYDRALLLSQAFLDGEDDVNLIYGTVDSIKLNPAYKDDNRRGDHCFVERITKSGQHIIYDTSSGFVFDKKLYWLIEHPKVRKINGKDAIKDFVKSQDYYHSEDAMRDRYVAPLVLPFIESTYGRPIEMYSQLGIELLQREIEHYKSVIGYSDLCREMQEDMRRVGIRK